ncbi:MAG: PilZ domain-containing protein [Nitrospirae bacterium]|nr:PilZ domain-containing protein [Nitrospirota bacterium]
MPKDMNRREYIRENILLPIAVKVVSREKQNQIMSKISGNAVLADFQSLNNFNGKNVSDWLTAMQERFMTMVKILREMDDSEGFTSLKFVEVNISGGGIKFFTDIACEVKDIVEIKIMLPVIPPLPLYVYGEVLRVDKHTDNYKVAVRFIALNEDIRKEIVNFITQIIDFD